MGLNFTDRVIMRIMDGCSGRKNVQYFNPPNRCNMSNEWEENKCEMFLNSTSGTNNLLIDIMQ